MWYRAKYDNRRNRTLVVSFSVIMCIISLLIYYGTAYRFQINNSSWSYYALTQSNDSAYKIFHQALVLIVQIAAFIVSSFAFVEARRKSYAAMTVEKDV